ncbi:transcriptional regulator [Sphingobacteriaceae bacterium]|nr:transcriptional regulator [Sphingobacteriaceae bacterium]
MNKQEGTRASQSNTGVTIRGNKDTAAEKKYKEIFEVAQTTRFQICPIRDIISRISDKWSMLSILALGGFGKMRFNELKNKIGDVSQRMLTVTLRNLEGDGLITRKIYPEVPPRVEYELTELGQSLLAQYAVFAEWASINGEIIIKSRKKHAA